MRYHCPDVKAYVVDYSPYPSDWGDYPEILGFEVVRQRCGLAEISFRFEKKPNVQLLPMEDRIFTEMLSRPIDVWNLSHKLDQRYIIYADSDLFWNGTCLPLGKEADYLHSRGDNAGLFYFDKESRKAENFLNVWMSLAMLSTKNRRFRKRLYEDIPWYTVIQDEMLFLYIKKNLPDLYNDCVKELDIKENFHPHDYRLNIGQITSCNVLHCMGMTYGLNRSHVPWLLREYQPCLEKYIKPEDIEIVYGPILEHGGRYGLEVVRDGIMWQDQSARDIYVEFAKHLGISLDSVKKPPIYTTNEGEFDD
jgi:hypothetical protein